MKGRIARRLLMGAITIGVGVGGLSVAEADIASAEESGETDGALGSELLTIEEIGEGECVPAVTVPGRTVDCIFPLNGEGWDVMQFDLPIVADLDVSFDDEAPATCEVVGAELRCEGIDAFYRIGRSEVDVGFAFGESRTLASFEVVDPFSYGIDGFLRGAEEPVAMEGRPVMLSTYPTDDRAELTAWALVRTAGDDAVIAAVPVETGGPTDIWPETVIDAPSAVGRYTLALCVGDDADTCDEVPGHFRFQVIDQELRELVAGHNRADAQRINVVFVGSGIENADGLVELATSLLGLDGPVAIDFDGRLLLGALEDISASEVADLAWGPFAIEPLQSNKSLFNFWYLEHDVADERALFHSAHPQFARGDELNGFGLDHVSVVTVHFQTDGRFGRSEANWTSFPLSEDVPELDDIEFAGIYLAVDSSWPYGSAVTLAHEFGHALFDLRDEYSDVSRDVQFGFPNCADGLDQAEMWWGDQIGEVDPFVRSYIELRQRFDLWVSEDLVEQTTVGFNLGGCYSGGDEVVRPTAESLMNSEIPVFGAVNRARVETLLGQFSGRAVLAAYVDASLSCRPGRVAVPGRIVTCRGSLAVGVDAPTDGLRISVAGRVGECSIGEVDDKGARDVVCEQVELAGIGPWTVTMTIDHQLGQFVTRIDNGLANNVAGSSASGSLGATVIEFQVDEAQTETTEGTTETTQQPTSAITGDGTASIPWALAAGGFAVLFIAVGGYLWSRGNKGRDERTPPLEQ